MELDENDENNENNDDKRDNDDDDDNDDDEDEDAEIVDKAMGPSDFVSSRAKDIITNWKDVEDGSIQCYLDTYKSREFVSPMLYLGDQKNYSYFTLEKIKSFKMK